MTLTYRPNHTGTLLAAYLGDVRIGYVEQRIQWIWQLSIGLGPMLKFGKEDTEEDAREALERSLSHWIESAGLRRRRTE